MIKPIKIGTKFGRWTVVSNSWADQSWIKINGIDRKHNKRGYTIKNCVTCCKVCNIMKRSLPYKIWINHLKILVEFRKNNRKE